MIMAAYELDPDRAEVSVSELTGADEVARSDANENKSGIDRRVPILK